MAAVSGLSDMLCVVQVLMSVSVSCIEAIYRQAEECVGVIE